MRKYLLGLLVLLMTLMTGVSAEDNPRAVIIFDASGSMWGQIDGKTKIEIARDALKNVLNEWNPSVELGLTVYGHRSKGDCNDIETIIPVGKIDKNRVVSTVMAIQPKGKTPISRSLRKVAEEIKYTEEKATIILISDGQETCDADPCGTAKELKKEGIDFVTHVIGFNVDKKTDAQLQCIANATGGEYFSAKNATALNEAMKTIVKKVEVAKPIAKPKVKAPEYNLEISASESDGGKWIEAYHEIHEDDGGKAGDRKGSASSHVKEAGKKQLPVGKYILTSSYNQFKKTTPFEVKAGEVTKVHVVMGETGIVEISASESDGGKWIEAYHEIHEDDGGKAGDRKGSASSHVKEAGKKQLPVGKYILTSSYNQFKKTTPFEVKAGEVTKVHVVMGETGIVEVTASEKEGGKWIDASNSIYKDEEGKAGELVGRAHSYKKRAGTKQLPVGKYILKSTYNDFEKEASFEIKAGETTKIHFIFTQFIINVKCIDINEKVSYEIYASNGQLVYEARKKCSETLKLTLDNGNYTIEAKMGAGKKELSFTVSGDSDKLSIDMTDIKKEPSKDELIQADK